MTKNTRFNLRGVIDDILAGLGDVVIMEKYGLSPSEFMEVLEKVRTAKGVDPTELEHRINAIQYDGVRRQERRAPRNYMMFATHVYDSNDPGICGVINDMTEKGLQITGIQSYEGEIRSFFVVGSDVIFIEKPLQFEAQCKWTGKDDESGEFVAGFQITKMTPSTLRGIRRLVNKLGVTEKF